MTMREYPKSVRRSLRALAAMAYEEEMRRALSELAQGFDAWRAGKIDVWELNQQIHEYHNGPSRELYNQYGESHVDLLVASAIVRGIISRESVPAEVAPYLEPLLASFQFRPGRGAAA